MNQYKLSYTGAQVDNLLGRAATAITPESESLSDATKTAIRNNINAASKSVESSVSTLTSRLNTTSNDLTGLTAVVGDVQNDVTSLGNRVVTVENSVSSINTLDYTSSEYLAIARKLADIYSASSPYFVGQFCKYSSYIYECKTTIGSSGEAWNSSHWTQLGSA